MKDNTEFDAIIVGGSYSGMSAAMALGRSLRRTLIIDSGKPCNRYTPHSHNFLTQDGSAPARISSLARAQLKEYQSIQILEDLVVGVVALDRGFEVQTQSGRVFRGEKMIFATGVKDILPDLKGFEECWGKSVIHCPYCHGYEFRSKRTAIWADTDRAMHLAALVRNLSDSVTILTNGYSRFTPAQHEKLGRNGVNLIEKKIDAFTQEDGQLQEVIFQDGSSESFNVLYAGIPYEQHCPVPAALGCELTEQGLIKTDAFFNTTVDGIYACGDNVSPLRSVANSVANGNLVGAVVNGVLATQSFDAGRL